MTSVHASARAVPATTVVRTATRLAVAVAVASLAALAACGGAGGRPAPDTSPSPATPPGASAEPRVEVQVEAAPDAAGDTAVVDRLVRTRRGELRNCYEQEGLKRNPDLAGEVVLELTVGADGRVAGARVRERSWRGPGATEAESCMVSRARGWATPGVAAGGTFEFAFDFRR